MGNCLLNIKYGPNMRYTVFLVMMYALNTMQFFLTCKYCISE